jgi:hypothetical protein
VLIETQAVSANSLLLTSSLHIRPPPSV